MPSVVGTPLYCAPEVINETMYGNECDAWAVGIQTFYSFLEKLITCIDIFFIRWQRTVFGKDCKRSVYKS